MATRASVAILNEDGTVTSIYNHSDGYLTYLGVMLRDCYNTLEAVQALIDLGDVSVVGPTLEESVFYHRDRKEPRSRTIGRKFDSVTEWRERAYFEYMYLFDGRDNTWSVYQEGKRKQKL